MNSAKPRLGQKVSDLKVRGYKRVDKPGERPYQIWIGKKFTALVKSGKVFQVNLKPSPGVFVWAGEK